MLFARPRPVSPPTRPRASLRCPIPLLVLALLCSSIPSAAELPATPGQPEGTCAWSSGFGGQGADDQIDEMVVWDDGNGAALYAAGEFTALGSKSVDYIAKWDGSTWSSLDGGMSREVRALAVWDDGTGEALYAGGVFTMAGGVPANYIAKWDGTSWSAVGSGTSTSVYALTVWDDGSGSALYAAGRFGMAGGVTVNRVAKWDGTSWSALGTGISQTVETLAGFDDGDGPALYAGGWFTSAGGVPANRIAKWDGTSWSALGDGADATVYTLRTWNDGGGDDLYAGGSFDSMDGNSDIQHIARWDGSAWSKLGSGSSVNGTVYDLTAHDTGSGEELYAVGSLTFADGVLSLRAARFDGANWNPLSPLGPSNFYATSVAIYDDGNGPLLFLGGNFTSFSGLGMKYLATWDGADWAPVLDADGGDGLNGSLRSFAVFDDGSGPALYAGGDFTSAGSAAASRVAKWDGTAWSTLGAGQNQSVTALAVYDDGSGPALYATSGSLVRWDGTSWTSVQGFLGEAYSLAVHDDGSGPALYVGGRLVDVSDDLSDLYVGKWDGSAWSHLFYSLEGGGGPPEDDIFALETFDRGGGDELFAGGQMPDRGHVLRYDGLSWSLFDTGLDTLPSEQVNALAVFDDGLGAKLYAGGSFTMAGGASADYLGELDGSSWTPMASGISGSVTALETYDDGQGPGLYAAGTFTTAGGGAANRIARWDGSAWSALGSGIDASSRALIAFDSGSGAELYAGGDFLNAGSEASARFARWSCPSAPGPDLGLALDSPDDPVVTGLSATYALTVTNASLVDVPRSTLEVSIPAQLDCAWQSHGTGGASGYSEGSGAMLADTLVMPVTSSVVYTLSCGVAVDASGTIDLTASLVAPLDSDSANDQSGATTPVLEALFADGFESGECSRWSECPSL